MALDKALRYWSSFTPPGADYLRAIFISIGTDAVRFNPQLSR